ncbi:major facilitator superfamily domain-containing protein 10-like [Clytia hemisphaerica]|uniref:Major facilitator superfamily (MFS) profile domain-containing protein n=1 Tax=Clytia hemisphaerica TaxID=252671 RepID=A0A7M5VBV1_9CNID
MKSIYVIFMILYLDLIAFTIILPLFPSIIEFYDNKEQTSTTKDGSLRQIHDCMEWFKTTLGMPDRRRYNNVLVGGILGSIFSLLQFICSPTIGFLSDVLGRKKVLVFSMLGTLTSYFIWWKSETFTLFLVSRIVGGLLKGSVTIATTMMSDVTNKENRGKGMAFIGLGFSLGFITGPMIGAYFVSKAKVDTLTHAFALPAQVAMVIQLVALLATVFLLDETIGEKKEFDVKALISKIWSYTNPISLLWGGKSSGKSSKTLHQFTIINFIYLLIFSGLEFTLTFVTHERFNFTSMQQGKLFLFAGIIMMLVQGGYVRRMKHRNEKKIAIQGMFAMIPAMITIAFASTVRYTYIALALYSFGAGTVVPCLTALFSQHSENINSGENIGIFRSAGALARAIAPFVTCTLYWSLGSVSCYLIGAGLFILPLFLLSRVSVESEEEKKSK